MMEQKKVLKLENKEADYWELHKKIKKEVTKREIRGWKKRWNIENLEGNMTKSTRKSGN